LCSSAATGWRGGLMGSLSVHVGKGEMKLYILKNSKIKPIIKMVKIKNSFQFDSIK
jgi:hypothetical protein